ncbi:Nose resistant to fluoxetine protein 6 like protein [Argiope bruennichi]|uniref:Nose resistant to fluoxetine protein 6 like protein n=1 Tax=Argiope bruennichi TaxID=94029 RepID=A0A8T0G6Q5_ARGBR|nr:Nose resistant to fluoxetine protein 6 like protein [Argiope bruennichi]
MYDLVNWIQKTVDYVGKSEKLDHMSEDDIKLLNGLPNFVLPLPFSRMLRDVLSESESSKCGQDLDYVFENIFSPGGWSMKMTSACWRAPSAVLDSYGKPESGILLGNLRWLGDYDECVGIYAPAKGNQENITVGNFHGRYCTLQVPLILGNVSLPLSLAACLPDSCNTKKNQKSDAPEILNSAENAFDFAKYIDHWIFQIILNGFFSVDSFFLLSGFLVAYVFFKQADKTDGKIPWLYFYIHRYVRLTIVYFMIILIHTFILPYVGSGPLWPDDAADKFCRKNWWWNLLYINNFVPQGEQCFPVAWYLANDMQFYIISPLFLITLWRWPKIGYSMLGAFFSITFIANFVLTLEYNLIAGLGNIIEYSNDILGFQNKINEFFNKIYFKPYARIGPYLVGILLAYYLHKRKKENADKLSRIHLTVGWIVASGLTLTCQFGLYHQRLTPVGASFYNAFSRTIFGFGLAWVIFVCIEGQANIVNRILSWKPWIPLSRLTFCAYLIHPIVQTAYYNSLRTLILFNHNNMFMMYMGFLIISYAFSLVVSLLLESPVIRLERLLRNKFTSK